MSLALLLPVSVALLVCWVVWRGSSRYKKALEYYVTPPGLPGLGNIMDYWGDQVHIFKLLRFYRKNFGTRFVTRLMDQSAINVSDAEATEAILTSSKHITKGPLYTFLVPWLGRGLLTNFGASWHHRRKLLTPAFHFKILDEFGPMISGYSATLVQDLRSLSESTADPVDVVPPISKATLRTICETAMGVELSACGQEEGYFKSVRTVGQSVAYRLVRPWLWRNFVFNLTPYGRKTRRAMESLHFFTRKVISERKSNVGEDVLDGEGQRLGKRRLAFLDMLLAAQREDPSLTDEDIREEVDTFMFEGHETTAMAICWTLFALGNNLDIQARVREEIATAGGDWQKVNALPYLEMVIKESLRLYPPVFYIERDNEQPIEIGKGTVPPGVYLDVHIFDLHRDPAVFPEPLRFDPERFSPDRDQGRHPFAYVPFSGGLRNCIGRRFAMMELKLMIGAVVGAFSIKSQLTEEQMEFLPELVLRSSKGIKLLLEPL